VAKGAFDLALGSLLLVLAFPLLGVLALAIRASMGSPILFRQKRIGLHRKEFVLIKFRTMRPPTAIEAMLLTDRDRVTWIGRIVRRTSLDELPTLFNVVRGDMSLVGPRPLLPIHYDLMNDSQARRSHVKPGVTGLAQVCGRQKLTFSERVALDLRYLETWSLLTDLRILARTVSVAIAGSGVSTGQELEEVDDIGLKQRLLTAPRQIDPEIPRLATSASECIQPSSCRERADVPNQR
jgi:lipopolysaccharide/colanic/teichoic acid biosynthesis glycosyltransferase